MSDAEMFATLRREIESISGAPGFNTLTENTMEAIRERAASAVRSFLEYATSPIRFPTGMIAAHFRIMGIAVPDGIPDDAELWAKGWHEPTVSVDPTDRTRMNVRMDPIDPEWVTMEQST